MNGFRATLGTLAVLLAAAAPAHAHAQAPAEPAPAAAPAPVLAYRSPAPASAAPQPVEQAAAATDQAPTLFPARVETARSVELARPSVVGYTATGAVLGALLGTAVLYADEGCREVGSMCGLGIPAFAGGGALLGGLAGFLIARLGN